MADQAPEGSLDAAHRAFERGDFAEARRLAKVMAAGPDDASRAAAALILKRTGLDPFIIYLTAACVLFFALISLLR